jgi:glycosyltransferase involved in cell wall biosynthesis
MRVLHICSGNLYGGVETIQVALARYRDRCVGMRPGYAVCFDGRLSRELSNYGVPVHNLGAVRVRNPVSAWKARRKLHKLLSEFRYDAAVCHSAWTQAIFGPVVKDMGVPLLFWLHGAPSGSHWLERWASWTRPDQVICCSEYAASLLKKLYPGVRKEVIYPPISSVVTLHEYEEGFAVRKELKTPAGAIAIVQVSRMETWKGHRLHIEALATLRDLPSWVCWFVGGPQRPHERRYYNDVRRAAKRYGIADRVRFLGHRTDVQRILAGADLFCQPNTAPEPFGIVFVEALSAGLPVITAAMGGGLEIVAPNCGVLTPPNDLTALAATLRRLVTDSALRLQMRDAGPERARYLCDPSQQVKRLSAVIENTLARKRVA